MSEHSTKFRIENEEYITKSLRIREDLFEKGNQIAQNKKISFNKFINLALEFAIENFEE